MNTKQLIFFASFLSLMGMNACTNGIEDMDVLDINSRSDWQDELVFLLNENSSLLSNSGISLSEYKPISFEELDSTSFFNENTLIPTYITGTDKIELLPLDYIKKDTLTRHVKVDFITWNVNKLLKSSSHTAVELTWEFKGHKTKTIALFDTRSGELEYDNILFNLLNNNIKNKKYRLTKSEIFDPTHWGANYDIVYFYNRNNEMAAFSWYGWTSYQFSVPVYYDSLGVLYMREENYYGINYYHDSWTACDELLSAFSSYRNLSNQYYASLYVYTFVGPKIYSPSVYDVEFILNNPPGNIQPGGMYNAGFTALDDRWLGCWVESRLEFFMDTMN